MNADDYEIMAPVGSRDSLAAALKAGAGSVYFGVEQLNMRSHSANHFTIDDLREIAATCREAGVKSYLTVNTIIYDEDIPLMHQIVDAAREAGISAVIASDIAVMQYCQSVNGKSVNGKFCYDLSGRKVTTPTKGIYVKNGKKYIVK